MSDTDPMPGLTAYDRRWVMPGERVPVPRGDPAPFDRERAFRAWCDGVVQPSWKRDRFAIPRAMEHAEAVFWLFAATSTSTDEVRTLDVGRVVETHDALVRICSVNRRDYAQDVTSATAMQPLAHLFDAVTLVDMICTPGSTLPVIPRDWPGMQLELACGFCDHVAPFLGAAEFAASGARVRDALAPVESGKAPFYLYHLAAALRVTDMLPAYFTALANGRREPDHYVHREHLVYALGSPRRIIAEVKRRALSLYGAQAVRDWLAVTGRDGIAYAFAPNVSRESDAAALVDALGTVHVTATATAMLSLATRREYAEHAKAWLDRRPELAVPAAAAAAEKGTRRDAAVATLKRAAALGHTELVEAHASAALRAIVLGAAGGDGELAWLDAPPPAQRKPLRWLYADALPPLVVAGRELGEAQVAAAIDALRASTVVAPDPRTLALKRHATAASAERFALALMQQWLRAGAAAADKWALYAVGLLGGDEAATVLVPLVRRWPGESQHARAVIGLECLRAIGSDVALTHIAGLAQKLSFAALKRRANECLEEIARARNLTRDRLEDRIVPALDIVDGARQFTLHGHTYTAELNDELEPVLRDEHGKPVRDLPKRTDTATPDDDAARAEWKLFKKQLRDVAKVQAGRLESAMVSQRSWFDDEFRTLLIAHPIVGRLVRGLVWIAESANAAASVLFRILPDGTAVDADEAPVTLPAAATIRIVHRLELSERDLDAWETRIATAGIAQPIRQLDRVTYRLDDVELASHTIARFNGTPVAEPVILGRLRTRGWQRATPEDGGAYTFHWKRFEKAGVVALLQHDMIFISYLQPDARIGLQGCIFVRAGDEPHPYGARTVPLRDVSAVALSEVCADCAFVLG